jgi:hypothetical protein
MEDRDLDFISNDKIPESIRASYIQTLSKQKEIEEANRIEHMRVKLEARKFIWNTPIVAALSGLITLTAAQLFGLFTANQAARNAVTLAQVQSELKKSETNLSQQLQEQSQTRASELQKSEKRLSQQLQEQSRKSSAELENLARERAFEYEIVKQELANPAKTNAQRAEVLLFLARAGVLSTLKEDALEKMAQEQIANPSKNIIPALTSKSSGRDNLVWDQTTIPVCWENPEDKWSDDMALVKAAVSSSWGAHKVITFSGWERCSEGSLGLRILIEDGQPRTVDLGQSLNGVKSGVVLNFEFKKWGQKCADKNRVVCIRTIVVHEFGHVLGFAHEAASPDASHECSLNDDAPAGSSSSLGSFTTQTIMNPCVDIINNDGKLSAVDVSALQWAYGTAGTKITR